MRRCPALLVSGLLLLGLAACGEDAGPRIPDGPTLIGIGDSYVSGVGMPHELWITTVGRTTGRAVLNLGVAGTLSRDALRVARVVRPDEDDTVVISAGLNDLRTYGNDRGRLDDYGRNLTRAIEAVSDAGCVVVLPPLPLVTYALYPPTDKGTTEAVVAYELVADRVAQDTGARVADIATSWNPSAMLSADQAHPNALGDATIAASVTRAVEGCPT